MSPLTRPVPHGRVLSIFARGQDRPRGVAVCRMSRVVHDARALPRIRPRRPHDEVRRPDMPEGIEAARRKWEARLRADGMSRSEASRLATAKEVSRRIKESRVRFLSALRREQEEAEAAWRRHFKPYGFILTERQPTGWISRWGHGVACRVRFQDSAGPESFHDQVFRVLPDEIEPWGKVLGFEVHYSPDHSIRYDRDGKETEG